MSAGYSRSRSSVRADIQVHSGRLHSLVFCMPRQTQPLNWISRHNLPGQTDKPVGGCESMVFCYFISSRTLQNFIGDFFTEPWFRIQLGSQSLAAREGIKKLSSVVDSWRRQVPPPSELRAGAARSGRRSLTPLNVERDVPGGS